MLHAPSRRVQLMGGEYLASAGLDETNRGTPVTLGERPGRRYPVHAIWQERYDDGRTTPWAS